MPHLGLQIVTHKVTTCRPITAEFPRSIRIGARAVGWLESDIDQWIETRRIGAAYGRG